MVQLQKKKKEKKKNTIIFTIIFFFYFTYYLSTMVVAVVFIACKSTHIQFCITTMDVCLEALQRTPNYYFSFVN